MCYVCVYFTFVWNTREPFKSYMRIYVKKMHANICCPNIKYDRYDANKPCRLDARDTPHFSLSQLQRAFYHEKPPLLVGAVAPRLTKLKRRIHRLFILHKCV